MDMAELSEENLDLELRRSADGEEGKPTPAHKLRPVPDVILWTRAISHYAGIAIQAYSDKAGALWAYNCCFRQQLPSLEQAELGRQTRPSTQKTCGAGGAQRSSHVLTTEGQGKAKRQKAAVCFTSLPPRVTMSILALAVEETTGSRLVLLPWIDNMGLLALSEQ